MRMNGEVSVRHADDDEDDDGEEREAGELSLIGHVGISTPATRLVVGYALTSKKKKSFLQPELLTLAQ